MVAALPARDGGLVGRSDRADDHRAESLGPLGQDAADPAGGGVDQDALASAQRIAASQQEFRGHALEHRRGRDTGGNAVRQMDGAVRRHNVGLCIRPYGSGSIGGAGAHVEPRHALADRLDDAGAFLAEHRRHLGRVEARAVIGVDEVEADRLVPDADLAGSRLRHGDIDRLEHVGTAGATGLDGEHVGFPRQGSDGGTPGCAPRPARRLRHDSARRQAGQRRGRGRDRYGSRSGGGSSGR